MKAGNTIQSLFDRSSIRCVTSHGSGTRGVAGNTLPHKARNTDLGAFSSMLHDMLRWCKRL